MSRKTASNVLLQASQDFNVQLPWLLCGDYSAFMSLMFETGFGKYWKFLVIILNSKM